MLVTSVLRCLRALPANRCPRLVRTFADEAARQSRVCVVGSGPSGFYTAKYLLLADPGMHVDVIDKFPTPFGLVRYGVAPDHQDVKSVQNDFMKVAQDSRFRYLGNVLVGEGANVTVPELRAQYDGVVLACGAEGDRSLGIEGEGLQGVHSARAFVNWYNGHPDFVDLNPDLSCETAVVVGQGNVAVDCARILSKTVEELQGSDIAAHALAALKESKIKRVQVVGRRGHLQAAMTIKEIRDCTKLGAAFCEVLQGELDMGLGVAAPGAGGGSGGSEGAPSASQVEMEKTRAKQRVNTLLQKQAGLSPAAGQSRALGFRFLLQPTAFAEDPACAGRVGALVAERTVRRERARARDARVANTIHHQQDAD